MSLPAPENKREAVERMFDRIAPSYDRMNALISLGAHRRWKRMAVQALGVGTGEVVVDLACGTGDLACDALACGARVIGVDVSENMLEVARRRAPGARLLRADAEALPLADASVAAVVSGFALRNFVSIPAVLAECARVLEPAGRIAVLEVDEPRTLWLRRLHGLYFRRLVPWLGRLLADSEAYAYLPESTVYLPGPAELVAAFEGAGFVNVRRRRLMGGAAQLVTAERAARPSSRRGDEERPVRRFRCVVEQAGTIAEGITWLGEHPEQDAFVWQHPESRRAVVACGRVTEIRACGPDRFEQARRAWRDLLERTRVDGQAGPEDAPAAPLLVGGFGFFDSDPPSPWHAFPALAFTLPERVWVQDGDRCWLVRTTVSGGVAAAPAAQAGRSGACEPPGADEESATSLWLARAAAAIESIRSGELRKIVLARRRWLALPPGFRALKAISDLAERRPSCATFLVRRAGSVFLGSSPETLARARAQGFETAALAGSEPRGTDLEQDRAHAEHLLACPKNSLEHRVVVEELRSKLEPLCEHLHVSDRIELRTLPESFHLLTRFRGTLASGRDLFDLASALHPTSAVCGSPADTCARRLAQEEPERGWYAGACGTIDARGLGELTVTLRSALIHRKRALVWAGAGIVEGSRPEDELAEVESKMGALASALGASGEDGAVELGGGSDRHHDRRVGAGSAASPAEADRV